MSDRCRVCLGQMPKDRKGWEQVCPACVEKKKHKEKRIDQVLVVVILILTYIIAYGVIGLVSDLKYSLSYEKVNW